MYNPNDMPKTPEEFTQLIDHYYSRDVERHAKAVTEARAQAEAQWQTQASALREKLLADAAPDTEAVEIDAQLETLRQDFLAQAVSMVEPAKSRKEWELHFACFRPQLEVEAAPAPTLEELRQQKKAELDAAFHTACLKPRVACADGYEVDANETAYRNVQGLLITMENTGVATVSFCDADNNFHDLTQKQLEAIQQLIISHGQQLYAKKWELRCAIEAATDANALDAIKISFAA